jgi:hypothetical protein
MEEKAYILNLCLSGIWLDTLMRKPFDQFYIQGGLEIEHIPVLEKDIDQRKVIAHE